MRPVERVLAHGRGKARRYTLEPLPFLLPAYGLFLLFLVLPVGEALWLSLHQENLFGKGREWVGLGNYLEALSRPEFWKSVQLTLAFALITAPLELLLGLLAALLVYRPYPGVALFRTLFFLTTAVPTAVAAVAWGWFLHPVGGWANRALAALGLTPQPWLTSPEFALPTLAVITAWAGVGFTAILLTAGLQNIPEEVLEAATVDGAGPWTRFFRITLPLLSPTLFLVGLLVVLKSLTAFGQIHLLTRGGPAESTMVWIYRVYQDAFFNFQVPLAAAEAFLLFLLLLGLAALQFWLLGRRVHYA
ncbi:ABC transporter permease (plasmid) [Thermus brockianus]|uniref:ABC transporter permease n=1 Tax=Thermus brockianus TaxID=56956 RepID=A0A1J0LVF0_THEBO|nr:ABC transporter permease [Thermus brockianus]